VNTPDATAPGAPDAGGGGFGPFMQSLLSTIRGKRPMLPNEGSMEDWMSAYSASRGGTGDGSNFDMTGRGWNPYAQTNNPIFQASMPPPAPSLYQGGQLIYQPKVGQVAPYQQGVPTSFTPATTLAQNPIEQPGGFVPLGKSPAQMTPEELNSEIARVRAFLQAQQAARGLR